MDMEKGNEIFAQILELDGIELEPYVEEKEPSFMEKWYGQQSIGASVERAKDKVKYVQL